MTEIRQDNIRAGLSLWHRFGAWADAELNPLLVWNLHLGIKPIRGLFLFFLALLVAFAGGGLLLPLDGDPMRGSAFQGIVNAQLFLLLLFSCFIIPNLVMRIIQEDKRAHESSLSFSGVLPAGMTTRGWLWTGIFYQGLFWLAALPFLFLFGWQSQGATPYLEAGFLFVPMISLVAMLVALNIGFRVMSPLAGFGRAALFFFLIFFWEYMFILIQKLLLFRTVTFFILVLLAGLLYFAAIYALESPTTNRAVPIRIYLSLIWAGIIGFVIIPARKTADLSTLLNLERILFVMLSLAVPIVLTDRAQYGPRIRQALPSSPWLRTALFLFSGGPLPWLLWIALIALGSLLATGPLGSDSQFHRSLLPATFLLFLGFLTTRRRHDGRENWTVTFPDLKTFLQKTLGVILGLFTALLLAFSTFTLVTIWNTSLSLLLLFVFATAVVEAWLLRDWIFRQLRQFRPRQAGEPLVFEPFDMDEIIPGDVIFTPEWTIGSEQAQADGLRPLPETAKPTATAKRNPDNVDETRNPDFPSPLPTASTTPPDGHPDGNWFVALFGRLANPMLLVEWGNQVSLWRLTWVTMAFCGLQLLMLFLSGGEAIWGLNLALAFVVGWTVFNSNDPLGNRDATTLLLLAPAIPPRQAVLGWWFATMLPLGWLALLTLPSALLGEFSRDSDIGRWGLFIPMAILLVMAENAIRVFLMTLFLTRGWNPSTWGTLDKVGGLPSLILLFWTGMAVWETRHDFGRVWEILGLLLLLLTGLFLLAATALLLPSRSNRTLPVKDIAIVIWLLAIALFIVETDIRASISYVSIWLILHGLLLPFLSLDGPGPLRRLGTIGNFTFPARLLAFLRWSTPQGSVTWSMFQATGMMLIVGMRHFPALVAGLFQRNPPAWVMDFSFGVGIYVFSLAGCLLACRLREGRFHEMLGPGSQIGFAYGGITLLVGLRLAEFQIGSESDLPVPLLGTPIPTAIGIGLALVLGMLLLNRNWFSAGWSHFRAGSPPRSSAAES